MNRQEAKVEIARRLGWTTIRKGPTSFHAVSPKGEERPVGMVTADFAILFSAPDYFTDEAAARELVQWFKFKSWPAFYEALRAILIDNTGQPVGIVDFMLADPADKARAACVALEIELEEETK